MTVFEYVIAREAARLVKARIAHGLKEPEANLLNRLLPTVWRLEREEAAGWVDSATKGAAASLCLGHG
jgi:hypothetical protein